MFYDKSISVYLLFLFSFFLSVIVLVFYQVEFADLSVSIFWVPFNLLLVLSFVAYILAFTAQRMFVLRAAQITRILFVILCLFVTDGAQEVQFFLLISIIVEITIMEAYPLNLIASMTATTVLLVIRWRVLLQVGISDVTMVKQQILFACIGYLLSLFGSGLTRFRESIIDVQSENKNLNELAISLARLNAKYQTSTIEAKETGRTEERCRITRDIHDIVGYTLTNNIMLMENAIDMMQDNPLGIPSLIESARVNAEEGLNRIRRALYNLRGQESLYPVGILAISRLIRVFSEASGIEVVCEFGNVQTTFPKHVDLTLYHLVQETIINSLRHGKAERIKVVLWQKDTELLVNIWDNGKGSHEITEGIGLKGMRERIEETGGSLVVSNVIDGFQVSAIIPLEKHV